MTLRHKKWRKSAHGFSLVELSVTVAVLGILMAAGLPSLFEWMEASRVNAAPVFYMEGMKIAREGAIKNNGASRFVLTQNSFNGQFNWHVDWCSPTTSAPCNDTSGDWSNANSAVSTDLGKPPGPSIFRSADGLPPSSAMTINTFGESAIYFDSVGWLNSNASNITRMEFSLPAESNTPSTQLVINLSGVPERCIPSLPNSDSRACP